MKKYLVNILFLLTLCISSTTFAFPNEPNGFRDLYWGETLQEVKNSGYNVKYVSYNSQYNSVTYAVYLNNSYISGYKFDLVCLDFWNNQLMSIDIYFNALNSQEVSYTDLTSSLEARFGNSFYVKKEAIMWVGNTSSIGIYKNPTSNIIKLVILNNDLIDNAKQDAASKGW